MFATMLTAVAAAAATPSPTASSTPKPVPSAPAAAERRYCVDTYMTGSRIPHRDCRTRADWLKDGFDPTNPDQQ